MNCLANKNPTPIIYPLLQENVDKCSNSRGINLLSVSKLYGGVLIKKVGDRTECALMEQQCGFRQGRGCMDEVIAVWNCCRQMVSGFTSIVADSKEKL